MGAIRSVYNFLDVQELLTIDVVPVSWPIGSGQDFMGCYDIVNSRIELLNRIDKNIKSESIKINGLNDPVISKYLPNTLLEKLRQEIEMVEGLLPKFCNESFLGGNMTPIWFGSAINSFGINH